MKRNVFRITLSLMFAVFLLALFVGVADADQICQPDGRPAIHFVGGPPNREVAILAIDQTGGENMIKGRLDDKGSGIFPFGAPGVVYVHVLVGLEGQKQPAGDFKNVKCEPPKPTTESILGDLTKDWGRITDVITDWLTHWF